MGGCVGQAQAVLSLASLPARAAAAPFPLLRQVCVDAAVEEQGNGPEAVRGHLVACFGKELVTVSLQLAEAAKSGGQPVSTLDEPTLHHYHGLYRNAALNSEGGGGRGKCMRVSPFPRVHVHLCMQVLMQLCAHSQGASGHSGLLGLISNSPNHRNQGGSSSCYSSALFRKGAEIFEARTPY